MSLILKGVDMPKEKDEALLLLILGDGTVAEKIGSDRYEEMTDTKAIQIPTPHGRIIDADELKKRLYGYERWTGIDEAPYEYAEKEVYDAPTILEAEE